MRHFQFHPQAAFLVAASVMMVSALPLQASDSDQRIERSARASYTFKTYLKDDAIKVDSSAGVVTLTGTVSRDYHKFLAQDTVSGLPGVVGVKNELRVIGDQPSEHSDGWVTMKVKAVLAFHQNVSASGTEVSTQDGVVTLTGKADSEAQRQLTAEYAKDVDGVTDVRNDLTVSKHGQRTLGEKVDDTSITAQVKTTLLFHKSTHALATKVTTKDGVVTLAGEARNDAERDLVTKLAGDVRGVKKIHNRMTVK